MAMLDILFGIPGVVGVLQGLEVICSDLRKPMFCFYGE